MSRFKNREVKESKSTNGQFITFGIQKLKITGISHVTSKKETARKFFKFKVEGAELGGDFEGFEGAKGQIGDIGYGNSKLQATWFNPEMDTDYDNGHKESFLDAMVMLAEKAGVRSELDAWEEENSDADWFEMLDAFVELMENKYMWIVVAGQEYEKGKFSYFLGLGISGKNEDGYLTFSPLVKHNDFPNKDTKVVRGGKKNIILAIKGTNVTGIDKGTSDTLEFDLQYHYKEFETSDNETNDDDGLGATDSVDDDLPF